MYNVTKKKLRSAKWRKNGNRQRKVHTNSFADCSKVYYKETYNNIRQYTPIN